jgi:hypothetical protein
MSFSRYSSASTADGGVQAAAVAVVVRMVALRDAGSVSSPAEDTTFTSCWMAGRPPKSLYEARSSARDELGSEEVSSGIDCTVARIDV